MPDKNKDIIKGLKDSLNGIEDQVDKMLKVVDAPGISDYMELLIRFGINMIAIFILIRLIYYARNKNKDFLFTYFLFNTLIFLIIVLMSSTKIKMGFAFGLFAIFSIIRYRTVTVPVKEMGYFFTCVALGLINGMADTDNYFMLIIIANVLILLITYFLDRSGGLQHENFKQIVYERIDLIQPDRREEMIEDLKKRTGLPIHRVEVNNVNFLRDTANIFVYYFADENENRSRQTS